MTHDPFDPYHIWLAIPPKDQPPTYYQLLGLQPFEANIDVIRNAAEKQTIFIKRVGTNEHEQFGQTLLNQIQEAKLCLCRPDQKQVYDQNLRAKLHLVANSRSIDGHELRQAPERRWRIGCDPICEIKCMSPTVSAFHSVVSKLESKTVIEDLGSKNGTFVNTSRVVNKTEIHAFDLVVLGRETRIRLPLEVFNGSAGQIAFGIIGRNLDCEISIQDDTVSHFHAKVWIEKNDLFIEDLNSTNGTFLLDIFGNATRLAPFEPSMLDLEQSIRFGKHLLQTDFLRNKLLEKCPST
jgi:pSer/pThr/pTyr-binding forkhead associated (FHA) protein